MTTEQYQFKQYNRVVYGDDFDINFSDGGKSNQQLMGQCCVYIR